MDSNIDNCVHLFHVFFLFLCSTAYSFAKIQITHKLNKCSLQGLLQRPLRYRNRVNEWVYNRHVCKTMAYLTHIHKLVRRKTDINVSVTIFISTFVNTLSHIIIYMFTVHIEKSTNFGFKFSPVWAAEHVILDICVKQNISKCVPTKRNRNEKVPPWNGL